MVNVKEKCHEQLSLQVWEQVREQLQRQVREQVWWQVREQIDDKITIGV